MHGLVRSTRVRRLPQQRSWAVSETVAVTPASIVADAKAWRKPRGRGKRGLSTGGNAGAMHLRGDAPAVLLPIHSRRRRLSQRATTNNVNVPGRIGCRGFGSVAVAGGRGPNSAVTR